jgi:hypothetical protein
VARHTPDKVTEEMDKVLDELAEPADEFVSNAARRVLRRTEW